MAAIDKIYVKNRQQYLEFRDWCEKQPLMTDKYGVSVSLMRYVYKHSDDFDGGVVFCGPYYLDAYLIRNCPFDYIQEELMLNYGHWSQEKIDEAYNCVMHRNDSNKDFFTWLTEDDFSIVDGVVTMPNLEKSSYELIKEGKLYVTPFTSIKYEAGGHIRCIKRPVRKFNYPFGCKRWFVDIDLPEDIDGYMWYHSNHNSWDFSDEFVVCDWSSSSMCCSSIRSLKRLVVKKWKLPVGTEIRVTGRYVFDGYRFIVTK